MKKQADAHRRDVHFEVDDKVHLKLRPYRQRTMVRRINEKLAPRYFGPYEVIERIGGVAYRLQLPPESAIHQVFHVSQLKRVIGEHTSSTTLPATLTKDMEMVLEPLEVGGVRRGETGAKEVLIQWRGLPEYEATWESYQTISIQFPAFHLENNVSFWEGSIVGPAGPTLGPAQSVQAKPIHAEKLGVGVDTGEDWQGEKGGGKLGVGSSGGLITYRRRKELGREI